MTSPPRILLNSSLKKEGGRRVWVPHASFWLFVSVTFISTEVGFGNAIPFEHIGIHVAHSYLLQNLFHSVLL